MKTTVFRKGRGALGLLIALLVCGATPSYADPDFKKLATDLASRIQAMKRSRVTVVDFGDLDGKPNKLGKFLAQRLQATLAEPDYKLEVVDQSHTGQLFEQAQKLSEGLIDQAAGQEIGKMLGTEVLIVGTVMPSSMSVRVEVKAVDLQTAKMIVGGKESVTRIGVVERLAAEAANGGNLALEEDEGEDRPVAKKVQEKSTRSPDRLRYDQGIAFEIEGCSMRAGILTCGVIATSDGKDRWVSLSLRSRTWNDAGEEFGAGEVAIANTRSERDCAAKQLLKNVPTRLSLTFPQFEGNVDMVERLRLSWVEQSDCCCEQYRPLDFQKIALSEDTDFSSPRTQPRYSKAQGGGAGSVTPGKPGAGILSRLGGRVLEIAESAAIKMIEKETNGLVDLDEDEEEQEKSAPEEEEEEEPKPKKKKKKQ